MFHRHVAVGYSFCALPVLLCSLISVDIYRSITSIYSVKQNLDQVYAYMLCLLFIPFYISLFGLLLLLLLFCCCVVVNNNVCVVVAVVVVYVMYLIVIYSYMIAVINSEIII